MKNKNEVFAKLKEYIAYVENQTNFKIKALHSDNGGKHISKEFNEFCSEKGISRQFPLPYSPQQNGVAERMNRSILESTCSMLYAANLRQNFWTEAVATAVYLRNRSSSKFLKNVTPYEIFNGNKPNVSHLKVFGCKAMVYIPKANQNGKLNQQSAKCIFVGYPNDGKGYKFYNPVEKNVS